MRKTNWKDIAELIGIASIVASLVFVGLQMRQTEDIAIAELNSSGISDLIDLASLINTHPGIWLKGNAGEPMNPEETLIFENLVKAINDAAFFGYVMYGETFGDNAGEVTLGDFSALLFENPGARRVWEEREDRVLKYRNFLVPDHDDYSVWRDSIQAHLEKLDQWQAEIEAK